MRKISPDNQPDRIARAPTRNTNSLTKALPTMAMSGTVVNLTPKGTTHRLLPNQSKSKVHPEGTIAPITAFQRRGMALLENKSYAALMSFITLYCLFADDFRAAFFSKSADMGFYVVAFLCLLLFLVEFGLSCRCKHDYLLSFYFYLDVLATFSLLPDIGFIWNPLTDAETVSSVSQAGAKAGRIVRVVRVIRLVRIVKLIKWKHSTEESDLVIVESKTGGRMAEMTTRRVVMIVLFLCFVLPAFDGGYNEPFNLFESRGFDLIHQMSTTPADVSTQPIFLNTFGSWFYYTTDDVVYLTLHNITGDKLGRLFTSFSFPKTEVSTAQMAKILPTQAAVLDMYRVNELRSITSTGCFAAWNGSDIVADPVLSSLACQSVVWFDIATVAKATAISSIYRTVFILGVLVIASLSFVHVARIIVLNPIERMMATIKQLAESPLGQHLSIGSEQQRFAKEQGFETAVLEATLDKISGLMQMAKILPTQAAVLDMYRVNELRSITSTGCFAAWNGSDIVADPVLSSLACQSVVWFDIATVAKATAISSIYRTVFILGVLVIASLSFVHVARIIVLNPIERMMATIKQLAESPLGQHLSIGSEQQRFAKEQGFETAVLEATLDKISGLMQSHLDTAEFAFAVVGEDVEVALQTFQHLIPQDAFTLSAVYWAPRTPWKERWSSASPMSSISSPQRNLDHAINDVDAKGRAQLARACAKGDYDTVTKLLLHPKIDIALEDNAGVSPLEHAEKHGHHACATASSALYSVLNDSIVDDGGAKHDLLQHVVLQRVLDVKWELFGARKYYQHLLMHVLMLGAMTMIVSTQFILKAISKIADAFYEATAANDTTKADELYAEYAKKVGLQSSAVVWLFSVVFCLVGFVHLRQLKPERFLKLTRWMYDGKNVLDPHFVIPHVAKYKQKVRAWLLKRTILWTFVIAVPLLVVTCTLDDEGQFAVLQCQSYAAFGILLITAVYFLVLEYLELLGEDPWIFERIEGANVLGKLFWSFVLVFLLPFIVPFKASYRKYFASFNNKLQITTYLCMLGPFAWTHAALHIFDYPAYETAEVIENIYLCLGAFIILSLWMLSLQYLEVNKTAGYLLPIVKDVMGDVWDFLIFYGVFQCGLTCAYYFIFQQKSDSYKTLWASFRASYFVMYGENGVGDFNAKGDDKKHLLQGPIMHFGFILRMFHCAVMVVLLLNLLLAMMNKTVDRNWAKLQSRALASYARCVLRLETMLGLTEADRDALNRIVFQNQWCGERTPLVGSNQPALNPIFTEPVLKQCLTASAPIGDRDAMQEAKVADATLRSAAAVKQLQAAMTDIDAKLEALSTALQQTSALQRELPTKM
ncbi:hypothetical protein SDRG_15399 [Saprolegnia diclina VS20]|uniref:Uncharacterized protein n=1 Tax=Saprolegnia diclina (strain VS20) TaxID=1156394 RepID=T0PMV8_SAPDV|nr:hypothetical protein SDRG_15399 [Saprolegnia diclina VS20]EQC26749.1 hypothetical protein SDRG_15399 [Saprolegnia diclina VS20]|eukprot:XP_008619792.1 hypothetical protein SDRG_15399 [Saprolegnia diclina VS20]